MLGIEVAFLLLVVVVAVVAVILYYLCNRIREINETLEWIVDKLDREEEKPLPVEDMPVKKDSPYMTKDGYYSAQEWIKKREGKLK
jgi:predicted Holliday junction resolvase-like endonuclease